MFNQISWGSYFQFIALTLIVYYAFVLYKYYRQDLVLIMKINRGLSPSDSRSLKPQPITDELSPVVQSLTDEVTAFLGQAAYAKAGKAEIIFALQQIANKYEAVKSSSYQKAVSKLIQFECKEICAVHLNEEEVKQVWMG